MSTHDPIESDTGGQVSAPAKITIFGRGGAGVSTTALHAAIGLAKEQLRSIVMLDTAGAKQFATSTAAIERVPLSGFALTSWEALMQGLEHAIKIGAVYLVDDYTRVYELLVHDLREATRLIGQRIPAHQQERIAAVWDRWVQAMRRAPVPVILCARSGYAVDEVADETGARLVALGTQPRGPRDAMSETHLVIEMEARPSPQRATQRPSKRGTTYHNGYVLKDSTMALNGRTLMFRDLNDYKQGAYVHVFEALGPHFAALERVQPNTSIAEAIDNRALFAAAEIETFSERQRRVTIAIENLRATLEIVWPGKSDAAKDCRLAAIETLFDTRSMTALELIAPEQLVEGDHMLRQIESKPPYPTTRGDVIAAIERLQP